MSHLQGVRYTRLMARKTLILDRGPGDGKETPRTPTAHGGRTTSVPSGATGVAAAGIRRQSPKNYFAG